MCVRVFAVNHRPLAPQTGSFPQNFTDLLSADPEPAQRIQNLGQLHKPWSAHCACDVQCVSANNLTFSVWQGGWPLQCKKQGARRYSWELNRYMKKNRHISPFKSTATAGINSPSIQFHVQREKGEVMIVSELGNWQHSIISCAYTWLPITDKPQGKTSNDFVWQQFVTSSN